MDSLCHVTDFGMKQPFYKSTQISIYSGVVLEDGRIHLQQNKLRRNNRRFAPQSPICNERWTSSGEAGASFPE